MSFDLMHIWASMGLPVKLVALTMLIMGLLCLVVTIERLLVLNRATRQSLALAEQLGGLLAEGKVEEAIALAGEKKYKMSYLGPMVANGLTAFMSRRAVRAGDAVAAARRAIEKSVQLEDLALRKGFSILATTASSGPFVGLFGTVIGIINAFQKMGESGMGGISAVSAGIAEALVSTAFGLLVAIPATWAFNYFLTRVETIDTEMAVSTTELIDFCIAEMEKKQAA